VERVASFLDKPEDGGRTFKGSAAGKRKVRHSMAQLQVLRGWSHRLCAHWFVCVRPLVHVRPQASKSKKGDTPKRAPTSYMLFCNEHRAKVMKENPGTAAGGARAAFHGLSGLGAR